MPQIVLPADELNEFDLPRICVITGQTENVEFKSVKFAWYPRWIVALIIVNVLIAAIVAQIMTRRVKGQLPFTPEAYRNWWLGRIGFGLSFLLAIGLFILGCVMLDKTGPLGAILLLLAVAVPVTVGLLFVRNKGPVVQRIEEGRITLKLPSEDAVLRIQEHLSAGKQKPSSPNMMARSA